jgi:hypothetical protein
LPLPLLRTAQWVSHRHCLGCWGVCSAVGISNKMPVSLCFLIANGKDLSGLCFCEDVGRCLDVQMVATIFTFLEKINTNPVLAVWYRYPFYIKKENHNGYIHGL